MKKRRGDSVATKRERWLGGFVRRTKSKRAVYVIEKRIHGQLFKVSTRCSLERSALEELARFESNPGEYSPGGGVAVEMTAELLKEHFDWLETPRPLGKGNSHEWCMQLISFLRDWAEAFGGLDLRHITVAGHIKPALKSWKTSHPNRVVALKGFYTWLRKEKGLLKHHEDPMPDMRIPERKSAKQTTGARDVPFDRVQKVYRHMREDIRDILFLQSATGWHFSEARRFCESGEIRKDPTGKHLATLIFWHKGKESASVGISKRRHLQAAERLRAQGHCLSRSRLAELMRHANKAAGIDPKKVRPVYFGDMRHNVGTWAIEDGNDIDEMARVFNHRSDKMLRQHYVRHAVPRGTFTTRMLK